MQLKVSIVIPVFNQEKHLQKCLESVRNQTFEDFEVICVNDGSTDNSLRIIKEMAVIDSRFKLVNQSNKGLGASRNAGLLASKGEYILFVDSDDVIDKKTIEILYANAKEFDLDILEGRWKEIKDNKTLRILPKKFLEAKNVLTGKEYLVHVNKFNGIVWNKFWKRKFLIENNLKCFDRYYEDLPMTMRGFLIANRVKNIDFPFYYYYLHTNSFTRKKQTNDDLRHLFENRLLYTKETLKLISDSRLRKVIKLEMGNILLSLALKINNVAKIDKNTITILIRIIPYILGNFKYLIDAIKQRIALKNNV